MTKETSAKRKISVGDCLVYKDGATKFDYTFLVTKSITSAFYEHQFLILVLSSPDNLFPHGKTMVLNVDSAVGTESVLIKGGVEVT